MTIPIRFIYTIVTIITIQQLLYNIDLYGN